MSGEDFKKVREDGGLMFLGRLRGGKCGEREAVGLWG